MPPERKDTKMNIQTNHRSAFSFKTPIKIAACACAGGRKEKEGPLGSKLDLYMPDDTANHETWEKDESEMVTGTFTKLLSKADVSDKSIDVLFGGDLMNQCTAAAYGLSGFDIPYIGLYGACSTFAEGIILACCMIDSGQVQNAAVCVSSHFCTAERQYRFPLDYGAFPQPAAQNTVTGCGAVLLSKASHDESGVFITEALPGIVIDRGIKDAGNMGAAMATSAADTILRYLESSKSSLSDFDIMATGDLGKTGHKMLCDMLKQKGISNENGVLCDCGCMIYDVENQSVGQGGSGCGCSAVVTSAKIIPELEEGKIKKAAVIGTGAMMSPQSLLQGLSIPAVAHLAVFERR